MSIVKKMVVRLIEYHDAFFKKYIVKLFPTKENWIFFESEVDFSDNAYHLYDYMRHHREGYHYIWLVNDPKKYPKDEHTTFIGKKSNRLLRQVRITYYAHRSRYLFFTHPYWYKSVNPHQTIVNLWHGCAFKNMTWQLKNQRIFDYIIVTSDMYRDQFSDIFGFDREKVLDLGYPRNDCLLDSQKKNASKKIIWMPTYRKSESQHLSKDTIQNETGLPIVSTQEQLLALNDFLKEKGMTLYIKLHHLQATNPSFQTQMSHIIALTDDADIFQTQKLYEFVGEMDALVTDYSSIAVDYFLLDRPICYTVDDFEAYEANGGFYFEDCKRLMPGHQVIDFQAFLQFFEDLSMGKDVHKAWRHDILNETFTHTDNQSSERILNYFKL